MATTHIKTKNIHGETIDFSINTLLFEIIGEMKTRADHSLDNVIIITGFVGSGKSNLGDGIAGLWQRYFLKKEYTLDHVHFSATSVVKQTDREDNEFEVIKFDEAIIGGSGRAVLTNEGNQLKEALITKRRKKHLWIFIVDEIKELNQKIVTRCNLLIDVSYNKNKKTGSYRKGLFKIYSSREALEIYDLMKEKKIRTLKDYKPRHFKLTYNSKYYKDIFFSEKDYDNKKILETKQLNKQVNTDREQRNKLIYYMHKEKGIKQVEIAKELNMHKTTIGEIIKKVGSTID